MSEMQIDLRARMAGVMEGINHFRAQKEQLILRTNTDFQFKSSGREGDRSSATPNAAGHSGRRALSIAPNESSAVVKVLNTEVCLLPSYPFIPRGIALWPQALVANYAMNRAEIGLIESKGSMWKLVQLKDASPGHRVILQAAEIGLEPKYLGKGLKMTDLKGDSAVFNVRYMDQPQHSDGSPGLSLSAGATRHNHTSEINNNNSNFTSGDSPSGASAGTPLAKVSFKVTENFDLEHDDMRGVRVQLELLPTWNAHSTAYGGGVNGGAGSGVSGGGAFGVKSQSSIIGTHSSTRTTVSFGQHPHEGGYEYNSSSGVGHGMAGGPLLSTPSSRQFGNVSNNSNNVGGGGGGGAAANTLLLVSCFLPPSHSLQQQGQQQGVGGDAMHGRTELRLRTMGEVSAHAVEQAEAWADANGDVGNMVRHSYSTSIGLPSSAVLASTWEVVADAWISNDLSFLDPVLR